MHLLVALCVVAVVSFSLGLAAAPLSRRLALQATRSQPVARAPAAAPAITGARYDAGWAGGPGQGYQPAAVGDQHSAPPAFMHDHQAATERATTTLQCPHRGTPRTTSTHGSNRPAARRDAPRSRSGRARPGTAGRAAAGGARRSGGTSGVRDAAAGHVGHAGRAGAAAHPARHGATRHASRVLLCRGDDRCADDTTVRTTIELPTPEPTTRPPTPTRDALEPSTHETGNALLRQVLYAPSAHLILGRT